MCAHEHSFLVFLMFMSFKFYALKLLKCGDYIVLIVTFTRQSYILNSGDVHCPMSHYSHHHNFRSTVHEWVKHAKFVILRLAYLTQLIIYFENLKIFYGQFLQFHPWYKEEISRAIFLDAYFLLFDVFFNTSCSARKFLLTSLQTMVWSSHGLGCIKDKTP
jgi:hypothetical protein